jgi:hypothetical protein
MVAAPIGATISTERVKRKQRSWYQPSDPLRAVTAFASNDVWAVGSKNGDGSLTDRTLAIRGTGG